MIPTVESRHPLWEVELGEAARSRLDVGPTLDTGRETLGTSALDAEPEQVLRMPEDSIWPLLLGLALTVTAYGLLTGAWWIAAAGAAFSAVSVAGWLWP